MKKRIALMVFLCMCMSCISRHTPISEIHISSLTNGKQSPGEILCLFSPYTSIFEIRLFARDFFLLTDSNGVCKVDNHLNWYWIAAFGTNTMECGYSMIVNPKFPVHLEMDRTISSNDLEFLEYSLNHFQTLPSDVNEFTNKLFQAFYMEQ